MYKVVSEVLVWWPVVFAGVLEDGTVVENKVEMRFRVLDEDEIDEFANSTLAVAKTKLLEGVEEAEAPVERVKKSVMMQKTLEPIVRDWRQVAGANGEAWPFTDLNFQAFLRVPNVFGAILVAYRECRAGRSDVRAGN